MAAEISLTRTEYSILERCCVWERWYCATTIEVFGLAADIENKRWMRCALLRTKLEHTGEGNCCIRKRNRIHLRERPS